MSAAGVRSDYPQVSRIQSKTKVKTDNRSREPIVFEVVGPEGLHQA